VSKSKVKPSPIFSGAKGVSGSSSQFQERRGKYTKHKYRNRSYENGETHRY
ncbi:uncharacterized protein METZ01_LOCUS479433, partial [marine metagenome]